ncbi:hypothetical protein DPMN_168391 [Dreissena polymorpha]|uniref:Uncharacterized protein n=1 Tax=Dreissena polymorpha TaxID=45954 RepID=A0A9D4F0K1_DREPO|nr:hypothetical protein DPMN_168391 [Dreissena polymorpha]
MTLSRNINIQLKNTTSHYANWMLVTNILGVKTHIDNRTSMFTNHLENADSIFAEDIFGPALNTAEDISVTMTIPGQSNVVGTSDDHIINPAPTSCTLERSFNSTLAETSQDIAKIHHVRLQALRIMHDDEVHRDRINTDRNIFIQKINEKFGRDPHRLHFLFRD